MIFIFYFSLTWMHRSIEQAAASRIAIVSEELLYRISQPNRAGRFPIKAEGLYFMCSQNCQNRVPVQAEFRFDRRDRQELSMENCDVLIGHTVLFSPGVGMQDDMCRHMARLAQGEEAGAVAQ